MLSILTPAGLPGSGGECFFKLGLQLRQNRPVYLPMALPDIDFSNSKKITLGVDFVMDYTNLFSYIIWREWIEKETIRNTKSQIIGIAT